MKEMGKPGCSISLAGDGSGRASPSRASSCERSTVKGGILIPLPVGLARPQRREGWGRRGRSGASLVIPVACGAAAMGRLSTYCIFT